MDAEETIQARRRRLASIPRACEGCKIRKIRCDRKIPCANCNASKITCRHPNDKSRHQLQADKVADLEGLVERLEGRLHSVESRLAVLEHSQPTPVTGDAIDPDVSAAESGPVEEGHLFVGSPSFTKHSVHASERAQIEASLSSHTCDDPAIDHSLSQLQTAVRASHAVSRNKFFFSKSTTQFTPTAQPLPATLVTCIIEKMRVDRPIFLSSYAISDLALFNDLCQKVYFTQTSASASESGSVHGVLFFVLKELIATGGQLCQKFDLATHLDHCERNFIAAIETYEVLAVPSFESILALTMGMIKAQGEGKPDLYWTLGSAAITHCQSLGYHRESTFQSIPSRKAESIRRLFWTLYTFEKNMSLVLGRVSNLQSLDIDTQHPTISSDSGLRAWDESFIMGIKLAALQGRIFVDLYSTVTMARAPSDRAQLISALAREMESWHIQLKQIDSGGVKNPHVFHLSRGNWDILFYSTLTLLFHASPASGGEFQVTSRCFNAARSSLRAHLDFFPQYRRSQLLSDGDYFNWILLSSSFIPFIVTFLHCISARDTASVELLDQVVGTLENFRRVSKGSERLYQICATFTQVASKLVQSSRLPIGVYDETQDSLRFPDTSHSASLFHPEVFQDAFGSGDIDCFSSSYATGVLNDWLSGPPFPWDTFDVDFEGC